MEPNFQFPVRLTSESILEDARGVTVVPNFFYGHSDWINMRTCEKRALFVEWWMNQWEVLLKHKEVRQILGVKEPNWEDYWKERNDADTNRVLKTKKQMEKEVAGRK